MRRLNWVDWTALTLLVIGGLNWLLIGIFRFDLIAAIFGGPAAVISRIVYILVGISAVYVAFDAFTLAHVPSGTTAGMTGA
jgi:uncharacterized membrane protein YuzA (DUF378 family)